MNGYQEMINLARAPWSMVRQAGALSRFAGPGGADWQLCHHPCSGASSSTTPLLPNRGTTPKAWNFRKRSGYHSVAYWFRANASTWRFTPRPRNNPSGAWPTLQRVNTPRLPIIDREASQVHWFPTSRVENLIKITLCQIRLVRFKTRIDLSNKSNYRLVLILVASGRPYRSVCSIGSKPPRGWNCVKNGRGVNYSCHFRVRQNILSVK